MKQNQILDRFKRLEKASEKTEQFQKSVSQYLDVQHQRITLLEKANVELIRKHKFYIDLEQKILRSSFRRFLMGIKKSDLLILHKVKQDLETSKKEESIEKGKAAVKEVIENSVSEEDIELKETTKKDLERYRQKKDAEIKKISEISSEEPEAVITNEKEQKGTSPELPTSPKRAFKASIGKAQEVNKTTIQKQQESVVIPPTSNDPGQEMTDFSFINRYRCCKDAEGNIIKTTAEKALEKSTDKTSAINKASQSVNIPPMSKETINKLQKK